MQRQSAPPRRVATSAHKIDSSYGSCGGLRLIIYAIHYKQLSNHPQCDKVELT
jgi:hypothetical protein